MISVDSKHTMRLSLTSVVALVIMATIAACNDDPDNVWDRYETWRTDNESFFEEQRYKIVDGLNYYQTITPVWNSSAQVLIRYLNDRTLTEGNLTPLLTSTVAVKYRGHLYNGEPFDSSYTQKDSIFTTSVGNVIDGWTIALQHMRVGDSAEVVIPYHLAYGSQSTGKIVPYSTLIFNIKLVDIPYFEVRP